MIDRSGLLNISRRAYWLAVGTIVLAYLALWGLHFSHIYGWIMDDRIAFIKGKASVNDWRWAFSYYNLNHLYNFVFSYLPLRLGLALPSYELPMFGRETGYFRFFLLYTTLFHATLVLLWAWFATRLASNRLVAALSVLLLATSPMLALWSPLPDTRLVGLPFIIMGIWILLHAPYPDRLSTWSAASLYFVAGSFFGLSQSMHHTSFYLTAPFSAAFWSVHFYRRWRKSSYWLALGCFVVGLAWQEAIIDYLSYSVVGIPWEHMPTLDRLNLRDQHQSGFTLAENTSIWAEIFLTEFGVPLLIAVGAGWIFYLRRVCQFCSQSRTNRLILGLSILLAGLYLCLAGSQVFFRQTSVLQPFLFLWASLGIVWLASRFGRRYVQATVCCALLILVGARPWGEAIAVFDAHLSLGEALEWTHMNLGDRSLIWFPVAWFDGVAMTDGSHTITTMEELRQAAPGAWLISYFPRSTVLRYPWLRAYLEAAPALASWPSLYATNALRMELKGRAYNDFRADPVMSDIRIIDVDALMRSMSGPILPVESITADSVASPATEPAKVFDLDQSPDGVTAWVSGSTMPPHTLEMRFAEAISLSKIWIVAAPDEQWPSRIDALDIDGIDENGLYHTIWIGTDLRDRPTIRANWPEQRLLGLRLVIRRQWLLVKETTQGTIQEILFPGYRVQAPGVGERTAELSLNGLDNAGNRWAGGPGGPK